MTASSAASAEPPSLTSRDVVVRSGDLDLLGTVTTPDATRALPGVLLLVGSGVVNRDSDHRRLPLGVTRLLAEQLGGAGLASLRYDKRGVGASGGDFMSAGLDDNVADAAAALAVMRTLPEVDADRVLVVGHSEGAFIAAAVGAAHEVDGVGLLSGGARTGEEILLWQADAIRPTLPRPVRALIGVLRIDLAARQRAQLARLRATREDVERVAGRRVNARWLREFLAFDPATPLGRITAPVLAVTGAKDLQAPPEDVAITGTLVGGPFEGHVVEDVNHILRRESGPPSLRSYRRLAREPLDARVAEIVATWARRVTDDPSAGT